jgi:hypothetical protein
MSRRELEEIWAFYSRFVERSGEAFIEQLAQTDEIGVARYPDGRLGAFWATSYVDVHRNGVHHRVIYTVWGGADPSVRRTGVIRLSGFGALARQRIRFPRAKLYWFFTASTVNAYRFMATSMREYYPAPDKEIPDEVKALCEATAKRIGGDNWDLERGVLVRNHEVRYREGLVSPVSPAGVAVDDPIEAAFARLNPFQSRGDSLMCMCPLHGDNVRYLATRIARNITRGADNTQGERATPHAQEREQSRVAAQT